MKYNMGMKTCDLHLHSTYSDGTFTPEEVVELAIKANVSAIALTDHNMVDGNERFFDAAKNKINVLAGCEFSTDIDGEELHLLGLFLDLSKLGPARQLLNEQLERKEKSNEDTINALKSGGYDVSYEEFISLYGKASKNRAHIARYLLEKGIIKTRQEAFESLLAKNGKYYKEPAKLDFIDTIRLINHLGGVSIWAHPLFNVDMKRCEEILIRAKEAGLDGVEVIYSTYTDEETEFMKSMVKKFDLLPSGGSDFHGANKPDINIGVGRGNLVIPYSFYEAIKKRIDERN